MVFFVAGEITVRRYDRSVEFNKSINSKDFDKSYLALSKILHSDMRDFFQTDFGKEYYNKWVKEHGKIKPKHTQYDYEDDEDE